MNLTVSVARARGLLEDPGTCWWRAPAGRVASALDDAYTAGRFLRAVLAGKVRGRGLTDAALAAVQLARHHGNRWDRLLRQSAAGRRLIGLGFGEDVRTAGRQDEFPVLAAMKNGRITGAT